MNNTDINNIVKIRLEYINQLVANQFFLLNNYKHILKKWKNNDAILREYEFFNDYFYLLSYELILHFVKLFSNKKNNNECFSYIKLLSCMISNKNKLKWKKEPTEFEIKELINMLSREDIKCISEKMIDVRDKIVAHTDKGTYNIKISTEEFESMLNVSLTIHKKLNLWLYNTTFRFDENFHPLTYIFEDLGRYKKLFEFISNYDHQGNNHIEIQPLLNILFDNH